MPSNLARFESGGRNPTLLVLQKYAAALGKHIEGHTYDYDTRNYSTAHVHMILNGALHKMIDSTECLIFIDTPNSLRIEDLKNGTTDSCWIYSELLASSMIQKKQPIRKSISRNINESFEHSALSVEYDVNITHLIKISLCDIVRAAN